MSSPIHRRSWPRRSAVLTAAVTVSLAVAATAPAAEEVAAAAAIDVRTFDAEALGEPPGGCATTGDVAVSEAPFGAAGAGNRAVRLIDDTSSATTTMVCDHPESDERYLSFGFNPQRHGGPLLFGIRGDTAVGGTGNAWWFGVSPIAGTDDATVMVYDGAAWNQLGRVDGLSTPGEFTEVTVAATADAAEITAAGETFITDLRRDDTVNLGDVVFSSAGQSAVGMEFYVDDLAVGTELAEDPVGLQFVDIASWVNPVSEGETSPEFRLVSFRPIGGASGETFEATVDWGAGPRPATVEASEEAGRFDVVGSHPYSETGPHSVVVDVSGSAGTSGRSTLSVAVERRSVVAVEPEGMAPRFPSVIRLDDGRLLAAYYSGIGHVDPQGLIRVTESDDNGETWSEPRTAVAGRFDNRDPKLTQLSDGTILLEYFVTSWEDPAGSRQLGTHVVRSEDGGQSWSDPIWIDTRMSCAQPPPAEGCASADGWSASHGPIVELANGDLLAPLYGVTPGSAGQHVDVRVYDGGGWRTLGRVEDFGAPGRFRPVSVDATATSLEITVGDETFSTDVRRDDTVNLTNVTFASAGTAPTGMEFYVDDLAVGAEAPPAAELDVRTFDDEPLGEPPAECTIRGDVEVAGAPFGDAGTDNRAVRLLDDSSTQITSLTCAHPASDEKHLSFAFSPERFANGFTFGIQGDTATGGTGNAYWILLSSASSAPPQRATVVRSTDGGLTWDGDNDVTIAVDDGIHFQEPNLTVLPSGEIVAGLRATSNPQVLYVSRSFDNGYTWTPAEPTDIPASSHDQLLLDDGSVLVTYGIAGVANRPTGGVLVPDAGGDWSGHHQIPIYDSGHGDQANPSSVEIEPGVFMTLAYDVPAGTLYGIFTELEDYRDPELNLEVTPATGVTAAVGEEFGDVLAGVTGGWGNPGASLTASIDWGDGTGASSGVVTEVAAGHEVTGSHLFDVGGTFAVTLTVADRTQTRTATVAVEVSCPETDGRETVVIGGVDSGVPNRATGGGCSIDDRIADERVWDDHGAFVRHVGSVADQLLAEGVIDDREYGALIRAAARGAVGR
ncbi:sialidase family protein [Jiangella sp. DSM 45060]|uniref:sialidase family protein n=1 Tax=Jiangella sp. DSM 45060 TaxID=1798224 RepID=UPI00087CE76D|nr:sialidase family protein [Jiangella sp. DSM 45060]SDT13899.1 BNR repeat-like domain-containing protein [Jiangella sp. DSM 45060]